VVSRDTGFLERADKFCYQVSFSYLSSLVHRQSRNFFAALDDSGDEAPAPAKSIVKKREPKATKKADAPSSNSKTVSKGDGR
jgi:hypothetical protein